MANWEVRWTSGDAQRGRDLGAPVYLTASDWMQALGRALERHGLDREVLTRAVCLLKGDGSVEVSDPALASFFVVRQVEGDDEALDPPSLHGAAVVDLEDIADAPHLSSAALPAERMGPAPAELGQLNLDFAALSADADPRVSASTVIDMLLRYVPAESAGVLMHDPDARRINFLAARGPAAARLVGISVPEGRGVAGVVIRSRTSLLIQEVARSPEHFGSVDKSVGYQTRTMLACPLIRNGTGFGVIELLNPFGGGSFTERHREAADLAALHLSRLLA